MRVHADGPPRASVRPVGKGGFIGDVVDIVTADFDDGDDPDLGTANFGTGDTSVLLNHGDATFAAAPNYPVDESGVFEDQPGRGFRRRRRYRSPFGNTTLLAGDGSGGFGPPVKLGVFGDSLDSADFDSDGDEDIVVPGDFQFSVLINLVLGPWRARSPAPKGTTG